MAEYLSSSLMVLLIESTSWDLIFAKSQSILSLYTYSHMSMLLVAAYFLCVTLSHGMIASRTMSKMADLEQREKREKIFH